MKKYRKHLVIPDVQHRPGLDDSHLVALSNYIEDKRPDVIVQLGDFADLPSLSTHSLAGEKEGKRYRLDVNSAISAMDKMTQFRRVHSYRPEMHLTLGNHEGRIDRTVNENPMLSGTMSIADLQYERFGWKQHAFLKVATIDGVQYSHYFVSGPMCRPVSSAAAMLRERQGSCVQGHVQRVDMAIHPKTRATAIMAGLYNTVDEDFLTPQGNQTRRQVVVLHEVSAGQFDVMFVSLDFLLRQYA